MGHGRWVDGEFVYVTPQKADSLASNCAKPGDLVFTQRGTLGQVALVPKKGADRYLISQSQMKVALDPTKADALFLYYVFISAEQQAYIVQNAITTGVPHTNLGILRNTPLTLPPLAEQKAIAAVLGALDDKIELNRRMNATLEAMARALFQSWFVDFDPVRAKLDGRVVSSPLPVGEGQGDGFCLDPATAALFPASFQESALGPIPHGWRAAHLEEIASVGSGKRPEGRCDVLSPECNIPLYGGGGRMGYVPSALYDNPILFTGRVGTLGLIFRTAEPSWPSDNTLIVEPQAGLFDFTYFVLKGFDLVTLNRGSTQPLLTQTDLKRQTFVLPTKDVVKAFADFSEPIFRQIVSNKRESRTLATLRDTLLPQLLSGEVQIPNEK
jgi:type I restriction enzyme S subunit